MRMKLPGLSLMRAMVTCRWTGRRIQQYLDVDAAAPLTPAEVVRLEAHLEECDRCTQLTREFRVMRGAFGRWAASDPPDPEAVHRLRILVDTLGTRDTL